MQSKSELPNAKRESQSTCDLMTSPYEFFKIACLSTKKSPDSRRKLENAIEHLASELREDPTVPADPHDGNMPLAASLLEDAAIELPGTHCAFRGCSWSSHSHSKLMPHLMENIEFR